MEAIKMVISAMPAWMAVVCLVGGVFIGALALVRLGYSVVVAKAAYKWICWAEENVIGSKMGEEKKKQVIKALRNLTERARVFGTVIFGQYRILSPLFLLLI